MINLKGYKKTLAKNKKEFEEKQLQEYKRHFQLALINLEQNLIEERMPEFKQTA